MMILSLLLTSTWQLFIYVYIETECIPLLLLPMANDQIYRQNRPRQDNAEGMHVAVSTYNKSRDKNDSKGIVPGLWESVRACCPEVSHAIHWTNLTIPIEKSHTKT